MARTTGPSASTPSRVRVRVRARARARARAMATARRGHPNPTPSANVVGLHVREVGVVQRLAVLEALHQLRIRRTELSRDRHPDLLGHVFVSLRVIFRVSNLLRDRVAVLVILAQHAKGDLGRGRGRGRGRGSPNPQL